MTSVDIRDMTDSATYIEPTKVNQNKQRITGYRKELSNLLGLLGLELEFFYNQKKITELFETIESSNPILLNDELFKIGVVSNFKEANLKKEVEKIEIKTIDDLSDWVDVGLKAVQSEAYTNYKLSNDIDMWDIHPQLLNQFGIPFYKVIATTRESIYRVPIKHIIGIFRKFKKSENPIIQQLGYWQLIRSGLFTLTKYLDDESTLKMNIRKLSIFKDKFFCGMKTEINMFDLFKISDFDGRPLIEFEETKKLQKINIGIFDINQNGLLCNFYIAPMFRGIKINDESILDKIFKFCLSKKQYGPKHEILYATTKNQKMSSQFKKFGFKKIGITYPPVSLDKYTLPSEEVWVFTEENYSDTKTIDHLKTVESKFQKTLFLPQTYDSALDELKEFLMKSNEINEEDFIGVTEDFLAIELLNIHTLNSRKHKTLLFKKDSVLFGSPIIYLGDDWYTTKEIYQIKNDISFNDKISIVTNKINFLDVLKEAEKKQIHQKLIPANYPAEVFSCDNIFNNYGDLLKFLKETKLMYGRDLFLDHFNLIYELNEDRVFVKKRKEDSFGETLFFNELIKKLKNKSF